MDKTWTVTVSSSSRAAASRCLPPTPSPGTPAPVIWAHHDDGNYVGRPYTPFDLALSASQRRGIYDLSQVNATRAPAYARLDVRVERRFIVGGRPLVIFGGVQNVTNRENVAQYAWNRRDNVQRTSIPPPYTFCTIISI